MVGSVEDLLYSSFQVVKGMEQFLQQCAVVGITQQMHPWYSLANASYRGFGMAAYFPFPAMQVGFEIHAG